MTRTVPVDRRPIIDGPIARIPLTQGQTAVIDAVDVPRVIGLCWHAQWVPASFSFYAVRNGSRLPGSQEPRSVLLHRLIMSAPDDRQVDHVNHDTLDNRHCNLRIATILDNRRNRYRSLGSSGFVGVYLMARGGTKPWIAKVSIRGYSQYIGYFATALEAAVGRDEWIRVHCPSEFWTFNFPRPGERGIKLKESA